MALKIAAMASFFGISILLFIDVYYLSRLNAKATANNGDRRQIITILMCMSLIKTMLLGSIWTLGLAAAWLITNYMPKDDTLTYIALCFFMTWMTSLMVATRTPVHPWCILRLLLTPAQQAIYQDDLAHEPSFKNWLKSKLHRKEGL